MTLHEYRMLRYEDFSLGIVKREMDWKDAENVRLTLPNFPSELTALDLLKIAVDEALIENNEPLTEENRKKIEEEVKQTITPNLEEWRPVILVKHENGYIDLSEMGELAPAYKVICEIPFSRYYNENDYSFEEDEDGPYLSIDMEPFNAFVKDYEEGKFN